VKNYFKEHSKVPMHIVSNPEFLKEGAAIEDFLRPDRIVIGCASQEAEATMRELYAPFVKNGHPIFVMDNASAELTKYAANAFLATKISFINELALLADKVGADINKVREGFTSDRRINPAFFYPGVGFGGSCFPKDVKALIDTGKKWDLDMRVTRAASETNLAQKSVLFEKMKDHFGNLKGKKIAVWGLSFKPRTDDVREAPAIFLIEQLHEAGATVVAFDPVGGPNAKLTCKAPFATADNAFAALEGADALALVTEWNEFRSPDFDKMKQVMNDLVIFDGRNVLDPKAALKKGFKYYCIGRQMLTSSNES
jgi:UDPglucose 6-dehydrogenase